MLVLSRAEGEVIMVGPDVRVTVLAVIGDVVRIGVDAPAVVDVHRDEVYREIQNLEAAPPRDDGARR